MDIREEAAEKCEKIRSNDEDYTACRFVILRPSLKLVEMNLLTTSMVVNTNLEYLNMYGSLRDDPDVMQSFVMNVLPNHPNLKVLNLGWNNIKDRQAEWIARGAQGSQSLRVLQLNKNMIGDAGAKCLVDAAKDNLAELDLSHNRIAVEGCRAISLALGGKTCSLLILRLGNNHVGDKGAAALAAGLRENGSLIILCLEFNSIGDEGCLALARALRYNLCLCELQLWSNPITSAGASALEVSLHNMNSTMEVLQCGWFTGVATEQQSRIHGLCDHNRRTKAAFDQMVDTHHLIPSGLWPETLELFEKKPTLIYEVITSKPDLYTA